MAHLVMQCFIHVNNLFRKVIIQLDSLITKMDTVYHLILSQIKMDGYILLQQADG